MGTDALRDSADSSGDQRRDGDGQKGSMGKGSDTVTAPLWLSCPLLAFSLAADFDSSRHGNALTATDGLATNTTNTSRSGSAAQQEIHA